MNSTCLLSWCNSWYIVSILGNCQLSKLGPASNILSLVLSMSWNISEIVSSVWRFLPESLPLGHHFFHYNHVPHLSVSWPSLAPSGCLPRVSCTVAVGTFYSSRTPFTFASNFTFSIITCHFFIELSSLLILRYGLIKVMWCSKDSRSTEENK